MIDHATFQVLDDSVPACSGSPFPGRIIALDVLPHEGDIVMNQNISLQSRKTALPDTWTAPVGATRRTASLTQGHMSASMPTGSLARWLTSVTLSSHGRKEPGRCGLPCRFPSVSALF